MQVVGEVTGGADSHYETKQLYGTRKGSVLVRSVAAKSGNAVRVDCGGERPNTNRKECLSSLAGQKESGVLYYVA